MKKFTKVVLYIIAGLIVAGALCLLVGGLGHGFSKVSSLEMKFPAEIHFGNDNKPHHKIPDGVEALSEGDNKEFDISKVNNLDFMLGAGEVKVLPASSDKIVVTNQSHVKLYAYIENDTLYIDMTDTSKMRMSDVGYIEIEIPEKTEFNKVDYELGAIDFEQTVPLSCEKIELALGAGEAVFDGIAAKSIEANIGAGNLELANTYVEDAEFGVGVGNLTFEGDIAGNLDIGCGMGNADFELNSSQTSHNFSYNASAGNINFGSREFSGAGTRGSIDNDADSDFEANVSMGNITFVFREIS